ncbi:unnamed protein product [Rotaria magnacalcarata]|uniref:Hexosyltransferase n=1 Tax=Rotaria magnacalcarata TaxID=392030 RepID=A0A816LZ49_9BILA|nr:unnamed protein product [Rotaria magnacalcarata]CAF1656571.1 unnamed protein product [Rotaria magnacalcarata]CAF1967241.1 unnamed protein product [Rotaria magnacalcarata]CAF3754772.1 unnamed protein product [Rotaria magnacalcarata]CAF3782781.1 unnamed protein product [Rotaria magnacalcarata]
MLMKEQKLKPAKKQSRFVLGILADQRLMNTLVNASRQTWIPSFQHDIFYFVGKQRGNSVRFSSKLNIVELLVDDNEYPPVNKTFSMWAYFYQQHLSRYNYFMAIDADTYVNAKNLQIMLNSIKCQNCYVGYPATGEPYERARLGLRAPYCLGMGYVIARNTLRRFAPNINVCRQSTVANHSDTELGRCIYRFTSGISCTRVSTALERVMYTTNNQGTIIPFRRDSHGRLQIEFPKAPPTRFFKAALVHPLKTSHAFYQFHRQVKQQLRPVLPPAFLNGSCVTNPVIQNETFPQNRHVTECRLQVPTQYPNHLRSLTAFIITLRGYEKRLKQTINNFKKHNIHLQRFYGVSNIRSPNTTGMTQGEWNFRLTMTRLIQKVIDAKLQQVLIVEDDAIPHNRFSQLFKELFDNHRCKECVFGGILMLGSTTWASGWKTLDRYNNVEKEVCRNICTENYGSFAVLLNQAVLQPILDWLREKNMPQPYDYVFAHVARLGYPVRLAIPNLIVSDIRHVSLIRPRPNHTNFHNLTYRAKLHRWKIENYMFSPSNEIE